MKPKILLGILCVFVAAAVISVALNVGVQYEDRAPNEIDGGDMDTNVQPRPAQELPEAVPEDEIPTETHYEVDDDGDDEVESDGQIVSEDQLEELPVEELKEEIHSSDWVVSEEIIIENTRITVDGDIVVTSTGSLILKNVELECHDVHLKEGGKFWIDPSVVISHDVYVDGGTSLTLDATTWLMNCAYHGQFGIQVNSSAAMYIINGSKVTAVDPDYHYTFEVLSGSTFYMSESSIEECGYYSGFYSTIGLCIYTDWAYIEDSIFTNNFIGLNLRGADNSMVINSQFYNNIRSGLYVYHLSGVQIFNSDSHDNGNFGVHFYDVSYCWMYDLKAYNHNNYFGFNIGYSNNLTFVDCNVSDTTNDPGIFMYDSEDITIRDSVISNNDVGIKLEFSENNLFYHNNFIDNTVQAQDDAPGDNDWHHPTLLEGNYWSDYTGVDDGSGVGKHADQGDGIGDTLIPHPTTDYDFYPLVHPWGSVLNVDTGEIFPAIQPAIDDSNTLNGHTLMVFGGTFNENVDVYKELDIIGVGADVTTVDAFDPSDHVIDVTADHVTISGFKITGATNFLPTYAGINIDNADYVNCTDNNITGNMFAVNMEYSDYGTIANNTIISNYFGVYMYVECDHNSVEFNQIINNEVYGIIFWFNCDENVAKNNIITNNSRGIALGNADWNLITHNEITKSNLYGIEFQVKSDDTTITFNTITNNGYGIFLDSSSSINTEVHYNNINGDDNKHYGISTTSDAPVDATHNWWGHPSGPYDPSDDRPTGWYNPTGLGDNVTDYVEYEPWLSAPFDMIFVDDDNTGIEDGSLAHPYNTISEAVNYAPSGYNIFIFNGTYNEDVVINKLLTFYGDSQGASLGGDLTINSGGCLILKGFKLIMNSTVMGEFGIYVNNGGGLIIMGFKGGIPSVITNGEDAPGGNASAYYEFQVNDGSTFEMLDSEVKRAGHAWNLPNYNEAGLWINTDNVIIHNSEIHHNNFHGLIVYNSSGHHVINCTIHNNSWSGIWGKNSQNNYIDDNDICDNGWNGISLSNAANSVINNNNVHSNNHNGISVSSGTQIIGNVVTESGNDGIVVSNSPNALIIANIVENSGDDGIYVTNSPNSEIYENVAKYNDVPVDDGTGLVVLNSDGCQIKFNILEENWRGMYIQDSDYCTISNNAVNDNSGDHGIELYLAYHSTITNNTANDNGYSGITAPTVDIIYNNTANDNGHDGISITTSPNIMLHHNTVIHNGDDGIAVSSSHNITIHNNSAYDNGDDGIVLSNSPDSIIKDNMACNNNGDGVSVTTSLRTDIFNITAIDSGHVGIRLTHSDDSTIINNTASFSGHGIYVGVSPRTLIDNNYANFCGDDGIIVSGSAKCVISNNFANQNDVAVDIGTGIVVLTSDETEIKHNEVNLNWRGMYVQNSDSCDIFDNEVIENTWYGIHLYYSDDNTITDNDVLFNSGEWDSVGVYLSFSDNPEITSNDILANWHGLKLWHSHDSTIQHNDVNNNSRSGISLEYSGKTITRPLIYDNTANSNGGSGISLLQSSYVDIDINTATFNSRGISLHSSHYVVITDNIADSNGYGIYLGGSNHCELYDNYAERVGGAGTYGIYLSSSSHNNISHNYAKSNYFGISLVWSSNHNTVYLNDVRFCIDYGAYLYRAHHNTVDENDFESSTGIGAYLERSDDNDITDNNVMFASNYGISLFESDLNLMYKNAAENCDIGISLRWSHHNDIIDNEVNNNDNIGIDIWLSDSNDIIDNSVDNNPNYGIHLYSSNHNDIIDNDANSCGIGIYLDWSEDNVIDTNTATLNNLIGIAVFWYSNSNTIINNNANNNVNESIRISYSENNLVEDNQASGSIVGIHLDWSDNNNIVRNNTANNNVVGICVEWFSDNNQIVNNDATGGIIGISVEWSAWNLIAENDASNNNVSIMMEWYSHNNTVTDNIACYSEFGIYLDWYSDYNMISFNNASENNENGITLERSDYNTVDNNTIINNYIGLKLDFGHFNVISFNFFMGNTVAIDIDPSNYNILYDNMVIYNQLGINVEESVGNLIYHNNFVNNVQQACCEPDCGCADNDNFWHHPDLLVGNYWSDYPGADDGSGTGKHAIAGDAIGDTHLPWGCYDVYPYTIENAWISGIEHAPYACANGPYIGNEGSPITFDASLSYDLDGDPIQYRWDLDGDGIWDTGWSSSPYATYTWNDDYSGIVIVEVSDGTYTDTHWTDVTVNNVAPTADFGNDGPKDEGSTVTVSFTNQYDPGVLDTTFTYSFDWNNDGTYEIVDQVSASATHTWNDNGIFTVRGRIKDKDGGYTEYTTDVTVNNVAPSVDAGLDQSANEGDTVSFSGSFTDPGSEDTHTIEWDYNYDGVTFTVDDSGSLTPSTVYTDNSVYIVALRVTDDDGAVALDTLTVTVYNVAPIAMADASQYVVDEGSPVSFYGSQIDPGADTFTYLWEFGDGSTSTEQNPIYTYMDNGVYTVYLTVTDDDGDSDTTTLTIYVLDLPPVADAGPDQTVTIIDVVTFNASGSSSYPDPMTLYGWDYDGDGEFDLTGLEVTHVFDTVGEYTVVLTVTDDDGSTDTDTAIITVLAPGVDLIPSEVTFSPESPVDEGVTVNISAGITNFGITDATNVVVRFYDGDPDENDDGSPDTGAVQIGSDIVFPTIASEDTVIASVTWTSTFGYHEIYVWVDPDDGIPEYDNTNNRAFDMILVGPDLVPSNLVFSPESPVGEGDTVTIYVDVTNEGGTTVTNVLVRFYEEDPDANDDGFEDPSATQIGDVIIPSLAPGQTIQVSIIWSPSGVGNYAISVWVDPAVQPNQDGLILEAIETNNIVADVMSVGPDLAVDFTDISFSENPVAEGTIVTITVVIHNYGGQDANDVVVNIYDNEIKKKALIGSVTIPTIAAGGTATITITFDTTGEAGYHDIWVVIDPKDDIEEYDDTNNQDYSVLNVV
ncbi:MAG: right-handed parallel beta-helix repeat-containing protein [Methanomassiliicoccales archaeon]|nr:MAG: right-handed parallel beta-helix repeat-containing protein [Methanomassiliicoccales archaeon]